MYTTSKSFIFVFIWFAFCLIFVCWELKNPNICWNVCAYFCMIFSASACLCLAHSFHLTLVRSHSFIRHNMCVNMRLPGDLSAHDFWYEKCALFSTERLLWSQYTAFFSLLTSLIWLECFSNVYICYVCLFFVCCECLHFWLLFICFFSWLLCLINHVACVLNDVQFFLVELSRTVLISKLRFHRNWFIDARKRKRAHIAHLSRNGMCTEIISKSINKRPIIVWTHARQISEEFPHPMSSFFPFDNWMIAWQWLEKLISF